MTAPRLRSPRSRRRPPRRPRWARTCAVPSLSIQGEAPRAGAVEAAHGVPAGAVHAEAGEGLALVYICGQEHDTGSVKHGQPSLGLLLRLHGSRCRRSALSPTHFPPAGLRLCCARSPPSGLPGPTHLYRRAGLTRSPSWRSPVPGDTGWQTPGTRVLGTPRTQPPRRPPRSSSRRPSGICRAGPPHTRPHPNAGNTAPGACLHRGTVTGSPPATPRLLPHGRYSLPQQRLSEMPSPVGTLQGE